ncbi:MAG: LCP family protein [Clostridia bacterium]|nr:LCP family protein [Clostridia bacterium]
MIKRFLAILLLSAMALTLIPHALADEPRPVNVLTPEETRPTPTGIHHYMLICMDSWAAKLNNPGHTDGLILVTVDEYAKRVMLTSFIRDMLIAHPEGGFGRINNIVSMYSPVLKNGRDGAAGIQMLIDVINSHFDLRIEKFIVVDFKMVENIINAVGGVDITITNKEANYLRSYAISRSSTSPALSGAGTYHFSGHAVVIYMRIRKVANIEGETQDVGRTRRARTVLTNIADSLKDITYEDATKLLSAVVENTLYTNMSTDDMMAALDLAMQLRGTPVEQIRMPIDGTYHPMPLAGMATQEVDFITNRYALWDFFLNSFIVVEDEGE